MTNRERIIACAQGKPIDRTPFCFYFGLWPETAERWKQEDGITNPNAWRDGFGFDEPVVLLSSYVNHLFYPAFEYEVLERNGEHIIYRNTNGEIVEGIEGKSGIPKIIKSPVTNKEEWEQLKKERLNPNDPARFPSNWAEIVAELKGKDVALQLGAFPCGLYGTLRDLMGVEGSLYAFYDEPELVKDIMDYLTEFWICIYERICKDLQIDIIHIWEDMSGKQGSLISPKFIKEFMAPNYRKLRDFGERHNIHVMQVDTDGDCEELIPIFADAGVNMMLPFEVAAGCDIVALRERYPYMSMLGGIDKQEIGKGREAIDKELARIAPLINKSGYFPALDHLVSPNISYKDYCYFVESLRRMIFGE